MDKAGGIITTIAVAMIGVAIVAVLVSQNAQTPQVLTAFGQTFGGILQVAVSPVTSSGSTGTLGNLLTNSSGNYLNTFAGNTNTGGLL